MKTVRPTTRETVSPSGIVYVDTYVPDEAAMRKAMKLVLAMVERPATTTPHDYQDNAVNG